MSNFNTLEEDFQEVVDGMRRLTETKLGSTQGEEQKRILRDLERAHEQAKSLLASMEAEIQRAASFERASFRDRVTTCKRSLDSTMSRINQRTKQIRDLDDIEVAQRARLMQGTQSLQRASESVHRSRQIAAETDEVGVNIIGELDRQGDALERTRDRLHDTQGALDKSRTILRGMAFRVVTSKLIMAAIIIVEIAILAGVVYLRFFKK